MLKGIRAFIVFTGPALLLWISSYSAIANSSRSQTSPGFCQNLLLDKRFGKIDQNDERILTPDLLAKNGKSELCGPVALLNALKKFERTLGLKFKPSSPNAMLKWLVHDIGPRLGVSDVREASNIFELRAIIQEVFNQNGVEAQLTLYNAYADHPETVPHLPLDSLKEVTQNDDEAVLLMIHYWKTTDGPTSDFTEGGHWAILSGYDPNADGMIVLADGKKVTPVLAKAVVPYHLKNTFYHLKLSKKQGWKEGQVYLAWGAIRIKVIGSID